MADTKSQEYLKALIEGKDAPESWVDEMSWRYPFFSVPRAMTLGSGKDAPSESMLLQLALTTHGADALSRLTGMADTRFDNFYPPVKKVETPTTSKAIDDFLEKYGTQSEEENALLERMIFNPVPDYAQQLAREVEENLPETTSVSDDTPDGRINRFILSEHKRKSAPSPLDEKPHTELQTVPRTEVNVDKPLPTPEQSLLSESLAKIYIKTHKYERAYEILSRLSLDFPEKNAYFADQLRFLKKLILNERCRNMSNKGLNTP